jgi:hypothetical protein
MSKAMWDSVMVGKPVLARIPNALCKKGKSAWLKNNNNDIPMTISGITIGRYRLASNDVRNLNR